MRGLSGTIPRGRATARSRSEILGLRQSGSHTHEFQVSVIPQMRALRTFTVRRTHKLSIYRAHRLCSQFHVALSFQNCSGVGIAEARRRSASRFQDNRLQSRVRRLRAASGSGVFPCLWLISPSWWRRRSSRPGHASLPSTCVLDGRAGWQRLLPFLLPNSRTLAGIRRYRVV